MEIEFLDEPVERIHALCEANGVPIQVVIARENTMLMMIIKSNVNKYVGENRGCHPSMRPNQRFNERPLSPKQISPF
jgi:hypothetical protein